MDREEFGKRLYGVCGKFAEITFDKSIEHDEKKELMEAWTDRFYADIKISMGQVGKFG